MKNTILGIILTFSILSYGQNRINDESFVFINKSKPILNAVGWAKNIKWISNKNVISTLKLFEKKDVTSDIKYNVASEEQNFISIFFKKITFKSKNYYCLYITKWDSGYKYPSIYEGYEYFKAEKIHIFDEDSYNKLINIENTIIIESKINISMRIFKGCGNQDLSINNELVREDKNPLVYALIVKMSDEGNIRFQLPVYKGNAPIYNDYKNLYDNFDSKYFEISQTEFNNLRID